MTEMTDDQPISKWRAAGQQRPCSPDQMAADTGIHGGCRVTCQIRKIRPSRHLTIEATVQL
jgi:hypothetical protein